MTFGTDVAHRLDSYIQSIGNILGSEKRRAAFATYVAGLMSVLPRKTAETIAAWACQDKDLAEAEHQRMLHIVGQSRWEDNPVRRFAAKHAIAAQTAEHCVKTWIIDDTGWRKKGRHSVGVQRQYSGTLGKVDNCQVGVSLVAGTDKTQLPLDFALYLPETWASDMPRRKAARVPDDIVFKTKPQIAIAMIERALKDELGRPEIVLADAGYGNSAEFRSQIRILRLHYGVGIQGSTNVVPRDGNDAMCGPETSVADLATMAEFRKITWTDGTKGPLASRFAFCRVTPAGENASDSDDDPVWLVIERPYDEDVTKFHLCSLPRTTSHKTMAYYLHQRWRTERVYEDLKGSFGLDHYEGRSFTGWHHHVTAAMVCYCFVAAEQGRLFSPGEAEQTRLAEPFRSAA